MFGLATVERRKNTSVPYKEKYLNVIQSNKLVPALSNPGSLSLIDFILSKLLEITSVDRGQLPTWQTTLCIVKNT